jgi:DNA polymerase-3 subunit epsilon
MSRIFDQPLAFVDIETTGGSHFTSRVLEVAVVRVEGGRVVREWQQLLYPGEPIPAFISGLTGITDADVAGKPQFGDVASELADVLEGAVFVAHNVRFDYGFLRMEFDRLGAKFAPQLLCTVRLSRRLFPQYRGHKLADLIARHGLEASVRHRAYDDAHCLWQFFRLCLAEFDLDTVEAALRAQLALPSLPSQLDAAMVRSLPEGPGVYIFEGDAGAVLYVGKSVTIRRRVLNHFAADHERGQELKLAQTVRNVRSISTPGELSALILESDLVKELQPLYNRQLRRREQVVCLLVEPNEAGYVTVAIGRRGGGRLAQPERGLMAVYSTAGAAKRALIATARQFGLCSVLLGVERSRTGCFGAQLGKCAGACLGLEAPAVYNARFEAAFASSRVSAWPFAGPVLITERAAEPEESVGYVVDQWCLLARLSQDDTGEVMVAVEPQQFDQDRYRIIRRYLSHPAMQVEVKPVGRDQLAMLGILV